MEQRDLLCTPLHPHLQQLFSENLTMFCDALHPPPPLPTPNRTLQQLGETPFVTSLDHV